MNKLSNFISRNKKTLILVLGLGLFFSLVPAQSFAAEAGGFCDGCSVTSPNVCMMCIVTWVASIPIRMIFFLPAILLALLALLSGFIYSITIAIVNWLTNISVRIPITPSNPEMGSNFIVNQAWIFTRDFADMFLILILVFIGLATILKLREYEAKKILPLLIVVALLINFSPVIVGFIVDIGNIVANYFLRAAGQLNNLNDTGQRFLDYVKTTTDIWTSDGHFFGRLFLLSDANGLRCMPEGPDCVGNYLAKFIGIIAYGGVLTAFYIFGTIVYFFVGILFFCRILYLWILMILAPLVFVLYILPATRKAFNEWWQELLKWSVIGIPMGFFLLLSNWIMSKTNQDSINSLFQSNVLSSNISGQQAATEATVGSMGGFAGGFAAIFVNILAPILSLALLFRGIKISKQLAPAAALQIIKVVQTGFKLAAGTALVAATGGAAAGLTVKGLAGVAGRAQRMESFMGKAPLIGKPLKYVVGKPMSWVTRGVESAAAPKLIEYQAKTRKVPESELKKIDDMPSADAEKYVDEKTKMLPDWLKKTRRIQWLARMAKNDTLKNTKFEDIAVDNARSLFTEGKNQEGNPYYQEELKTIVKNLPGVFKGRSFDTVDPTTGQIKKNQVKEDQDIKQAHQAFASMKAFGKKDKPGDDARTRAINDALKEAENTGQTTGDIFTEEDKILEVGLRYKYIFKEDIAQNKEQAIQTARNAITKNALDLQREIDQIIKRNATTATFVKDFKPEDVKKLADPDDLAIRVGLILGNAQNLQKIQDNFGRKKLDTVIKGTGGLDSATSTPEKLRKYAGKLNPAMAQRVLNTPAGLELETEARNQMVDADGQPTNNYNALKNGIELRKIFATNHALETLYYDVRSFEIQAKEQQKITESLSRDFRDARRKKLSSAAAALKSQIDVSEEKVDTLRDSALEKIQKSPASLRKDWEDKIEPLRKKR